jgi:hypothetical protein
MKVRDIVLFVMGVALIAGALITVSLHYRTLEHQRDEPSSGSTHWVLLPEEDFTIGAGECAFIAGALLCVFSGTSFALSSFKRRRKKPS